MYGPDLSAVARLFILIAIVAMVVVGLGALFLGDHSGYKKGYEQGAIDALSGKITLDTIKNFKIKIKSK